MVTRRKFSPEFKAKIVLELIKGERGLMQARYSIIPVEAGISRTSAEVVLLGRVRRTKADANKDSRSGANGGTADA